ncbi:MAG: Tim17/Tim22/Tim23/Pmp24 family-domain-containing protein [Lentinula lateritia]|uniref:Tim17/Tim22/Tim23/Pmp24 family-domain-containing protein n=1 Tax=Lentinula lateritia TaxID=40482 RepID=A0ABQ8VRK7_9AGAR|nr:Tim17/Tim22/Tim23/Pmp24 family-domain-containing protein [Lentinula novae-zelandiae]KAJ3925310.1 MAG: Tim17/Tim22/Tim23/Pmp24 family-domain-containing protein [Lentinula lateritia]KAJ4499013.1 Tim17/Tim22/Tim23/Pmp24 family-domain-containing protein [Lentinula lateritia]
MDLSSINDFLLNPVFHDYLAILKGARNGFVYGVKVRFPHALVMSILFGRGDVKTRLKVIYRATKQHAFNLAKFVSLYKTLLLLQKKVNGGKERSADTFIAGLIGGFLVFGERTAVNEQIVLYVIARVVASFIPRAGSPYSSSPQSPRATALVKPVPPNPQYFAVLAAVSWGAVMWLFKERGETIQPGMFNSMTYLYRDSEVWKNLKTLLWHNT